MLCLKVNLEEAQKNQKSYLKGAIQPKTSLDMSAGNKMFLL